jgi:putative beta barrel porin BBP7
MSIERTRWVCLLASIIFAAGLARGQDFNERYAAWQGRASMTQRMAAPSMVAPEVGGEAEPMPPTTARNGQRVLADAYSAPLHSPDYNRPWTNSPCATCSHNPGFLPASDPLGTCDYGGGGDGWGGCGTCGAGGCGDASCCACGGAGGGCDWGPLCSNPLVWARFEVLLWWRQGRDLPPLVTTDPSTESSATAGILPDAQTLFGGGRVGTNMQAGGRADVGFFTDPRQCVGFGDRFFGLGKDASNFSVTSNNVPVLAIPFVDSATGNNDALLIAYPGLRSGSINITGSSSVIGNDVYARFLLCRDCNHRLDFITGWNYTRVADDVQIRTRSTIISDPTIAAGTVLATLDQFSATNNFNGGILGLLWQRNCGCWSTQVLTRMSLGNMHETAIINGSGTATLNGTSQPTDGVFTRPSNIGRRARDEFTAITELGCNLGYRFSPCTQLTVGYTFIYWNDILQAGTGIDPRIGTSGGTTHPQFAFRHSDFWVQGLNLGLTREF